MPITDYAFEELNDGSGRGNIAEDGQQSEFYRCFKIAWADLGNFLLALKGGWKQINSTTWTHYTPDRHDKFTNAFCVSAAFEGMGLSSQDVTTKAPSWEYVKITACYKTFSYDPANPDPTKIIEEEFDTGADIFPLPANSLKVSATGVLISEPANLTIPTIAYTLIMPSLPELPGGSINVIMALLGHVNNALFGGAAIGKMLFLGMRATRKGAAVLQTDSKAWSVQLKFVYRDKEWTKLCIPGTGTGTGWQEVEFVTGGGKLYESGNLNLLLPNGQ